MSYFYSTKARKHWTNHSRFPKSD